MTGIQRIVANVETRRLAESRAFYTDLIGLRVAMDLGWIVTLRSPDREGAQLSLLTHDPSAPGVSGISIEVADVDAIHAEAVRRGERILHPLTDEPWGVRRFFVADPDGTVVNVLSHR